MSNRFLSTDTIGNVTDGSLDLYGNTIGAVNLTGALPIKSDSGGVLNAQLLDISDVKGLQSALNATISNPLTSNLDCDQKTILDCKSIDIKTGTNTATLIYNGGSDISLDVSLLGSDVSYAGGATAVGQLAVFDSADGKVIKDGLKNIDQVCLTSGFNMEADIDMKTNNIITDGLVDGVDVSTLPGDISAKLPLAGGTMTGDISMSNNNINNIADLRGFSGQFLGMTNAEIFDFRTSGNQSLLFISSSAVQATSVISALAGVIIESPQTLSVDTINERKASNGVVIDGCLIKDKRVSVNVSGTPTLYTPNSGEPCFMANVKPVAGIGYYSRSPENIWQWGLVHSDAGDFYIQRYANDVFSANVVRFGFDSSVEVQAGTFKANTITSVTATTLSIGASVSTSVVLGASAVPTTINGDLNMAAGKTVFGSKFDNSGNLSIGNALATSITIGRFPTTTTINGSCILGEAGASDIKVNPNLVMAQSGASISSDIITTNTIRGKTATALSIGATTSTAVNIGASGITTTIDGNLTNNAPMCVARGGVWSADGVPNVPMTTATTMTSVDTDYLINFGTSITGEMLTNFTVGSDGKMTYTGTFTKHFHMAVTVSLSDTKNANISLCVFKNGVPVQNSYIIMDCGARDNSTAMHPTVMLSTNDYLQLYGRTSVASNSVVFSTVSVIAHALANTP